MMDVHDDHKPYRCLSCAKAFKRKQHWKQHMEQHELVPTPELEKQSYFPRPVQFMLSPLNRVTEGTNEVQLYTLIPVLQHQQSKENDGNAIITTMQLTNEQQDNLAQLAAQTQPQIDQSLNVNKAARTAAPQQPSASTSSTSVRQTSSASTESEDNNDRMHVDSNGQQRHATSSNGMY